MGTKKSAFMNSFAGWFKKDSGHLGWAFRHVATVLPNHGAQGFDGELNWTHVNREVSEGMCWHCSSWHSQVLPDNACTHQAAAPRTHPLLYHCMLMLHLSLLHCRINHQLVQLKLGRTQRRIMSLWVYLYNAALRLYQAFPKL